MQEAGILDSLHVVKNSLLDATSIGTMLLTTEVAIVNEKVYFRKFFNLFSITIKLLQKRSILKFNFS